jgi:U3 small nucleolar RNA-associated protein 12
VIIGTKTGEIEIYDLSSGSLLETIKAHTGPVWSIDVRPDKTGFASGSADKDIKFWDFHLILDPEYSKVIIKLDAHFIRLLNV